MLHTAGPPGSWRCCGSVWGTARRGRSVQHRRARVAPSPARLAPDRAYSVRVALCSFV